MCLRVYLNGAIFGCIVENTGLLRSVLAGSVRVGTDTSSWFTATLAVMTVVCSPPPPSTRSVVSCFHRDWQCPSGPRQQCPAAGLCAWVWTCGVTHTLPRWTSFIPALLERCFSNVSSIAFHWKSS